MIAFRAPLGEEGVTQPEDRFACLYKNDLTRWFLKMAMRLSSAARQGEISLNIRDDTVHGIMAVIHEGTFDHVKEMFGDDCMTWEDDGKRYAVLRVVDNAIILSIDDSMDGDIEFMFVKDVEVHKDESERPLSFTPDTNDEMRAQIRGLVASQIHEFVQILVDDNYTRKMCKWVDEMKNKLGEDGFAELLERLDKFCEEQENHNMEEQTMNTKREMLDWILCVTTRIGDAVDDGLVEMEGNPFGFMMSASKETFEKIRDITDDAFIVPDDEHHGIIFLSNRTSVILELDDSLKDPAFTIIVDIGMDEDEHKREHGDNEHTMSLSFSEVVTDDEYDRIQEIVSEYLDRFYEILAKHKGDVQNDG